MGVEGEDNMVSAAAAARANARSIEQQAKSHPGGIQGFLDDQSQSQHARDWLRGQQLSPREKSLDDAEGQVDALSRRVGRRLRIIQF